MAELLDRSPYKHKPGPQHGQLDTLDPLTRVNG